MEDVIVWLIWGAILIGGVVSSAQKNKKKKAEAARRAAGAPQKTEKKQPLGGRSLAEILEELERQAQVDDALPEISEEPAEYYYEEEIVSLEDLDAEQQTAAERLEAMTFRTEQKATEPVPEIFMPENEKEQPVADILQDFDLKRAVIESEILKPKFEQY